MTYGWIIQLVLFTVKKSILARYKIDTRSTDVVALFGMKKFSEKLFKV